MEDNAETNAIAADYRAEAAVDPDAALAEFYAGQPQEENTMPDEDTPDDAPDYLRNFSIHLSARMRALGWDQGRLQDEAAIKTPQLAARAINGTGVDLALAAKIARTVGSHLPAMLAAYVCGTCEGTPPPGFSCLECGTEGERL